MIRIALLVFLVSINPVLGQRFGGIEIGAKGVKWIAMNLDLKNSKNPVELLDSGDLNTTLSALNGTEFEASSLDTTIEAVESFHEILHEKHKIPRHRIFVVSSSGLPKADNFESLIGGVEKSIGQRLDVLTVEDEVRLGIHGLFLQNSDRLGEALVIDVGSGNTKGGYIVSSALEKHETTNIFHLPGTVTFTTAVKELAEERHIDFSAANALAKESILKPKVQKQLKENDALKSRRLVYMNGGIVWAISTFLHPEMNDVANVPLTLQELHQMRRSLQDAKGGYPQVDLTHCDKRAKKDIEIVKKVFSPDNLAVGSEILCTLGETLAFQDCELYFVRNGRIAWLLGYVSERGLDSNRKTAAIAKQS